VQDRSSSRSGSTAATPGRAVVGPRQRSRRSKLDDILAAATRRFGETGYDATKLADIAGDVGIGTTALYHYFESKNHCLFTLITVAMQETHRRFGDTISKGLATRETLEELIRASFVMPDDEVLRSRIVVSEQGRLATPGQADREEAARLEARDWIRTTEADWQTFLAGAMGEGLIERQDPRLLTRAVLGILSSVWHWYRPDGAVDLVELAEFFTVRTLRFIGLRPPA
jgi:AcrR family transcriptional regulator